ncbi:hypothetical protein, partial [Enterococcus faecium]|uniref:hypothetical protein n=1 Tax=Enterococcus faecium TaxID=1352 RepID=UPI0034E939CC
WRAPPRLARGFRMVGRIVIHYPKLSAGGPHRQPHHLQKPMPVSSERSCPNGRWQTAHVGAAGSSKIAGNGSLRMMSGR